MIKVVTYNIHKAHSVMRGCHLHVLRHGLAEMDADIVCLQEVQDNNTKRNSPLLTQNGDSQMSVLQGNQYPYIAYGANAVYAHGNHGNAILSKYPIRTWQNIDVSDHRLEQRGLLHATVTHPIHGEIHVICAHFGLFKVSRVRQAQALIHHVRDFVPSDAPLIVAGDFNDWNLHVHQLLSRELHLKDAIESVQHGQAVTNENSRFKQLRQLTRTQFQHTRIGHIATEPVGRTFPSLLPWFKLDRMYVRGFEVASADILMGRAWRNRSDHSPIQANLRITTYQA